MLSSRSLKRGLSMTFYDSISQRDSVSHHTSERMREQEMQERGDHEYESAKAAHLTALAWFCDLDTYGECGAVSVFAAAVLSLLLTDTEALSPCELSFEDTAGIVVVPFVAAMFMWISMHDVHAEYRQIGVYGRAISGLPLRTALFDAGGALFVVAVTVVADVNFTASCPFEPWAFALLLAMQVLSDALMLGGFVSGATPRATARVLFHAFRVQRLETLRDGAAWPNDLWASHLECARQAEEYLTTTSVYRSTWWTRMHSGPVHAAVLLQLRVAETANSAVSGRVALDFDRRDDIVEGAVESENNAE